MATKPWPPFLPSRELLQTPGEERRQAGGEHFSEAVQWILHTVSHPQLSDLADWACGEEGNLHTSQISHMRNNRLRMLGTKAIDALGRVNQAVWVQKHHPELLKSLGCGRMTPRIQTIVAAYEPLVDPASGEPLGSGEFLELYLGYRRLPITLPRKLSVEEAEALAERLGEWLDLRLQEAGLSFRSASLRLQQAWQGEPAGGKRLVRVLAGLEPYTSRQLMEDWERIAAAVQSALEEPVDPWALVEQVLGGATERGGKKEKQETPARTTGAKAPTAAGASKAPARRTTSARTRVRKA